jgi:hypothetical protein
MKKKKNNIIAGSLLLIALMAGCSSGTSNNTTKSTPPTGPVNYEDIKAKFNPNSTKVNNSMLLTDAPSGACGSIMGDTAKGMGLAAGFLSLIPIAGPALGVLTASVGSIVGLFGGASSNSCIANEFANIEYQLTVQQNEINQIESYLDLSSNNIWNAIAGNATNIQNADYNTFYNQVIRLTGPKGLLLSVYSDAGFYDVNMQQPTSMTLNYLESYESGLNTLAGTYQDMSVIDYSNIISNISGSTLNQSICNTESGIPVCYQNVTTNPNSSLMALLKSTESALQETLISDLGNGQNVVPLLDDYNNALMAYYQQGLASIQAVYHVAYLANYLNYFQSVQTPVVIHDFLNAPGTYYSPTSGIDYNTAQENLTLLAAAMVNQLYQNVMGYIITDIPVGSQAYPNNQAIPYVNESGTMVYNNNHKINYSGIIGANTSTALQLLTNALAQTSVDQTSASPTMLDTALASNLQSLGTGANPSLLFYQYAGINNVASCIGNLESYNLQYGQNGTIGGAINSASCPSLLVDVNESPVNQSVLTTNTIQPYAVSSNGLPLLSGNVTNNVNPLACSPTPNGSIPAYNLYWYTPSGAYPSLGNTGTKYLMCGNWNTSNLYDVGNNGGIVVSSAWIFETMLFSTNNSNAATIINFPEQMPNSVMAIDSNAVWSQSLTGYQSLNPSSTGNIGTSLSAILSGWVNENWPSWTEANWQGNYHVAAVQTTLPDGFIAPYGVTINNYNLMYLSPGNQGGFTVGLSYNPNVLNAGVTINGQPLYDTNDINTNVVPWNTGKTAQLTINELNWSPVTSWTPGMNQNISTVVINGNRLVTVGGVTTNNMGANTGVGNVSVCVVNPNNSAPSIYTNGVNTMANNASGPWENAIVGYFDNCLAGMGSTLGANDSLWATGKNSITSPNGKYQLIVQGDGNLVLYNMTTNPAGVLWASNTVGSGSNNQLIMQYAGNLVLYSGSTPVWATPASTIGSGASNYLAVQNDGNLVLYSGPNLTNPVWASNTVQ